ncbi:MAG: ABC-2 family transporter protein [Planctomycetes bacterium]|nr:ABC-2 family transporter protein [Planctomycetota bacterium]
MRLRLLRDVFVIEAKRTMSYRADFWISVVGGLIAGIAVPTFMWSWVFQWEAAEGGTIGGRTLGQMVAYYIACALAAKVVRGADLPMTIATDIYQGGLTRYLLFPIRYAPFKYAEQAGAMVPNLLQLTLFGSLFLLVLDLPDGIRVTPATVAMAIGMLWVGNLLYFLMAYPLQLVSFWADNVWSLLVMLRFVTSLLGGAMLPLELFPSAWQTLLPYTPFPVLFYLPVQTLLGQVETAAWLEGMSVGLAWCLAIIAVTSGIWRRGTLQYTGVGI